MPDVPALTRSPGPRPVRPASAAAALDDAVAVPDRPPRPARRVRRRQRSRTRRCCARRGARLVDLAPLGALRPHGGLGARRRRARLPRARRRPADRDLRRCAGHDPTDRPRVRRRHARPEPGRLDRGRRRAGHDADPHRDGPRLLLDRRRGLAAMDALMRAYGFTVDGHDADAAALPPAPRRRRSCARSSASPTRASESQPRGVGAARDRRPRAAAPELAALDAGRRRRRRTGSTSPIRTPGSAIEYDGEEFHSSAGAAGAGPPAARAAPRHGWTVIVLTKADLAPDRVDAWIRQSPRGARRDADPTQRSIEAQLNGELRPNSTVSGRGGPGARRP